MIKRENPTILYEIRKKSGQEGYNSFCNGTVFAPRDMKIVGCYTDYMKCVKMSEEEKKTTTNSIKENLKSILEKRYFKKIEIIFIILIISIK